MRRRPYGVVASFFNILKVRFLERSYTYIGTAMQAPFKIQPSDPACYPILTPNTSILSVLECVNSVVGVAIIVGR